MSTYTYKAMANTQIKDRLSMMVASDQQTGTLGAWSTGKRIAVALTLNRADWLASLEVTMLDAMQRLEGPWLTACRELQAELRS